jgi:hypothetical protein
MTIESLPEIERGNELLLKRVNAEDPVKDKLLRIALGDVQLPTYEKCIAVSVPLQSLMTFWILGLHISFPEELETLTGFPPLLVVIHELPLMSNAIR